MGDRVSIQFKDEEGYTSPVLFNHWGGMTFVKRAKEYAEDLARRKKGQTMNPLDRLESQTVMVDFIRELTKNMNEVDSNLYLGKSSKDGDNSDNGHHIIKLKKVV